MGRCKVCQSVSLFTTPRVRDLQRHSFLGIVRIVRPDPSFATHLPSSYVRKPKTQTFSVGLTMKIGEQYNPKPAFQIRVYYLRNTLPVSPTTTTPKSMKQR